MGLSQIIKQTAHRQVDMLGEAAFGGGVTATLRVSPNGDGTNGLSWAKAYATIQDALDAASTAPEDCTLIDIGPHATFYDINRDGDPTWEANVILYSTHRIWAPIRNTHAGATSVMNFTGFCAMQNLAIFQTGTLNGISLAQNGFRIIECGFNSQLLTGPATSCHIDGSGGLILGGIMEDVEFLGTVGFTTGIHIENSSINKFRFVAIHDCLVGMLWDGAAPDRNTLYYVGIGDCALGLDIDTGDEQHFEHVGFHGNTRNVDDEVHNHFWVEIHGQFPIYILPVSVLAGVTVDTAAGADAWGLDTELIAAAAIDNPFRIVGIHMAPSAAGTFRLRLTATGAAPYFDEMQTTVANREASAAPSGTEFIHNAATRISGSSKSDTGNDDIETWIEIQEI